MSNLSYSAHAVSRMSQRALPQSDIELIREIGTDTGDGIFVRDKDVRAYEQRLKERMNKVRRLRGTRVVIEGDCIVTVYRATPRKQKHLLRRMD